MNLTKVLAKTALGWYLIIALVLSIGWCVHIIGTKNKLIEAYQSRLSYKNEIISRYSSWLLDELNNNAGVTRIYDATTSRLIGGTEHDYEYHVSLSPRIGRDDWEDLFRLPEKLEKTLIIPTSIDKAKEL